jgi:hypothetical protein
MSPPVELHGAFFAADHLHGWIIRGQRQRPYVLARALADREPAAYQAPSDRTHEFGCMVPCVPMTASGGDDDNALGAPMPAAPSNVAASALIAPHLPGTAASTPSEAGSPAVATRNEQPSERGLGSRRDAELDAELEDDKVTEAELKPETVRVLWEEFKLVQDKIDRIGDFHFRIRTWAITLVSAMVVGGFANKIGWYLYLISCLPVLSFHLIDRAQTGWQSALVGRAATLETVLRRTLQGKGPRIVHAIRAKQRELLKPLLGSWVVRNGRVFYTVMYLLLMSAVLIALSSTYCLALFGFQLCLSAP